MYFFQVLLISIITNYEPPTYGKYEYPAILNVLGLLYALAPLVPLFYFAIGEVYKAEGYSLQEVCKIYNKSYWYFKLYL